MYIYIYICVYVCICCIYINIVDIVKRLGGGGGAANWPCACRGARLIAYQRPPYMSTPIHKKSHGWSPGRFSPTMISLLEHTHATEIIACQSRVTSEKLPVSVCPSSTATSWAFYCYKPICMYWLFANSAQLERAAHSSNCRSGPTRPCCWTTYGTGIKAFPGVLNYTRKITRVLLWKAKIIINNWVEFNFHDPSALRKYFSCCVRTQSRVNV